MSCNVAHPLASKDSPDLPNTRLLTADDTPSLCVRDIDEIKEDSTRREVAADEVHMTVLSTANLVSWSHNRAEFMSKNQWHNSIYQGCHLRRRRCMGILEP
ncbi:hypothetical protein PAAG_01431 [Paracoccidioides lutzii Pb01]|uniref:LYC1 C-terminal domain-containing protein n=1 Tax=Paracoccidioides lutzii (strain ATCC MYA-826 / Pb01) TaxID=502779 RepID=C1GSD6_PARBA|nr:hypothetical protein PAAG_01431 [Paracoccidioides lutzii Pb01]EEH38969.2 hypothetical protein PAAG_01431 [Paracoccidioides lutzii Pb01]